MKIAKGGYCASINCHNNRGANPNISFFRFPKDRQRCKKWVINSRRKDLLNKTVTYLNRNCLLCPHHFEDIMFMNSQKKKLVWDAVPTIFDVPNPPKTLALKRPLRKRNCQDDSKIGKHFVKQDISCIPGSSILGNQVFNNSSNTTCMSLEELSPRAESPSDEHLKVTEMKQTIRLLRVKLSRTQKKLELMKSMKNRKKAFSELDFSVLSPVCAKFIESQLKMAHCPEKGRRWQNDDKLLALSLYYKSPKIYTFMSSIFTLPSKASIKRWLNSFIVKTGFNDNIFSILKMKASVLKDIERTCVLCIDEISLKSGLHYDVKSDIISGFEDFGDHRTAIIANSSLVFMLRGITKNFKQPIAYFISHNACNASTIRHILFQCLEKMLSTNFLIKGIVTDQGTNFLQLSKQLGISPEKIYFEYKNQKYFYFFDVPHLLKNIRNNLIKYNFVFQDKIAMWNHIMLLFEHDSQRQFRLAPKLTKNHVTTPAFTKMKVKLAAQTLSHSVAAALETEVACGFLPAAALHTAELVNKIDILFDLCNSSCIYSKKKARNALCENSENMDTLKELLTWMANLKVIHKTTGAVVNNSLNCIKGWQVTGTAILHLFNDLKNQFGLKFLLTRQLNQDPLENFFGIIRSSNGYNDNPIPYQFEQLFKHTLISIALKPPSNSNCSFDGASYLCNFIALTKKKRIQKCINKKSAENVTVLMFPSHFEEFLKDLPERNVFLYVCGYALKHTFKFHKCVSCTNFCEDTFTTNNQIFAHFKAYDICNSDFGSLIVPNNDFLDFMSVCESTFVMYMRDSSHKAGIKDCIIQKLSEITKPLCFCDAFPWQTLLEFYVTLRIHYMLKFTNAELLKTERKQRKYIKVMHL